MLAQFLILLVCVATTTVAFQASSASSRSVSLKMAAEGFSRSLPWLKKPKNLDGMIGNAEFDPIGFAESFDPKWLREAELKHGRVSMLAAVGWLVQSAGIHLPSPNGIYDTANPIDAFFKVGPSPLFQIFLTIGALESINHNGKLGMMDMHSDGREPGKMDLWIYGASQLKGKSEAQVADLKLKELKNGRLAMLAIGGMVHHQILAGCETFGTFPNPAIWEMRAGTWGN
jgi:light-harvesting complex I chlorophyll a/b binding protein 1/light-harvesting complex I chlorophyll a/b binding protein 4